MPLQQLADEIIRLSQQHQLTPVLITPRHLSLRLPFFVELSDCLASRTSRSIRIDWLRPVPSAWSLIADRLASRRAHRANRLLLSSMSDQSGPAKIQLTVSIARPLGKRGDLAVGLADDRLKLPTWAAPIRLGGSPKCLTTLQSACN